MWKLKTEEESTGGLESPSSVVSGATLFIHAGDKDVAGQQVPTCALKLFRTKLHCLTPLGSPSSDPISIWDRLPSKTGSRNTLFQTLSPASKCPAVTKLPGCFVQMPPEYRCARCWCSGHTWQPPRIKAKETPSQNVLRSDR